MNSYLGLCNVPLNNKYEHTLHFDSADSQQSYFHGKTRWSKNDFNYLRKDGIIKVTDLEPDELQFNYCWFINNDLETPKRIYAFINDIKYLSNGVTELYIETDVIQTYYFDYQLGKCFVEREHVTNDSVGLHTLPENLETGEYVCNSLIRDENLRDYSYVMMVTEWLNESKPLATNFGGIISAGGAYIFDSISALVAIIQEYSNIGKVDAINCVYMLPSKLLEESEDDGTAQYNGRTNPVTYEIEISKSNQIQEYIPRNNKLKCFPYQYILLSNNAGSSNVLKYENFSTDKCKFEVEGIPSIGGSIKCVPLNYKGLERIQEEGIMCGKFPTLSWSADLYTNWLTQNAVNIGLGITGGVVATIGGLATGNPVAAVGGLASITHQLTQMHQMEFTPNSARGNVNSGDINTAYKMNTFYFYKMSIKEEFAEIIDDYFSMYGYKVSCCKVPNKNHRKHYWFTKTIDANITGPIPTKHLNKIIECYNNGITFWRSTSTFRDYQEDNTII